MKYHHRQNCPCITCVNRAATLREERIAELLNLLGMAVGILVLVAGCLVLG